MIDWDGAKNTKKGVISPKAKDMNTSGGSALSGQSEHYTAPEIRRATADINKNVKIDPKSMDRTKKNMADAMAKKKIDGGKADVYALGVTSSNQMIGHDKTVEFTKLSNKDRRSSFLNKEGVPPKMKKNIMDMTNDDPAARPSMDEVSKRFREIERDGE